jgi:hypothetical protein
MIGNEKHKNEHKEALKIEYGILLLIHYDGTQGRGRN